MFIAPLRQIATELYTGMRAHAQECGSSDRCRWYTSLLLLIKSLSLSLSPSLSSSSSASSIDTAVLHSSPFGLRSSIGRHLFTTAVLGRELEALWAGPQKHLADLHPIRHLPSRRQRLSTIYRYIYVWYIYICIYGMYVEYIWYKYVCVFVCVCACIPGRQRGDPRATHTHTHTHRHTHTWSPARRPSSSSRGINPGLRWLIFGGNTWRVWSHGLRP